MPSRWLAHATGLYSQWPLARSFLACSLRPRGLHPSALTYPVDLLLCVNLSLFLPLLFAAFASWTSPTPPPRPPHGGCLQSTLHTAAR